MRWFGFAVLVPALMASLIVISKGNESTVVSSVSDDPTRYNYVETCKAIHDHEHLFESFRRSSKPRQEPSALCGARALKILGVDASWRTTDTCHALTRNCKSNHVWSSLPSGVRRGSVHLNSTGKALFAHFFTQSGQRHWDAKAPSSTYRDPATILPP